MSEAVPTIYAPPADPIRISLGARLLALAIAIACALVVYQAWVLRPSPDGIGTHREMGMYPCSMLTTSGIPCPTCGMTTSFAWFYKGNLLASWYVQPGGFVLAVLTGVLLCYAAYEAWSGRPIHRLLKYVPTRIWFISGIGCLAFGWGWKIMLQLAGIDGW